MRFWSLETIRSISRHGIVFHSYLGDTARFMTYTPLLVPLPSKPACRRQHIPGIALGFGFFGNPPDRRIRLAPARRIDHHREPSVGFPVPDARLS